jgi:hypothetical protein
MQTLSGKLKKEVTGANDRPFSPCSVLRKTSLLREGN